MGWTAHSHLENGSDLNRKEICCAQFYFLKLCWRSDNVDLIISLRQTIYSKIKQTFSHKFLINKLKAISIYAGKVQSKCCQSIKNKIADRPHIAVATGLQSTHSRVGLTIKLSKPFLFRCPQFFQPRRTIQLVVALFFRRLDNVANLVLPDVKMHCFRKFALLQQHHFTRHDPFRITNGDIVDVINIFVYNLTNFWKAKNKSVVIMHSSQKTCITSPYSFLNSIKKYAVNDLFCIF